MIFCNQEFQDLFGLKKPKKDSPEHQGDIANQSLDLAEGDHCELSFFNSLAFPSESG